MIKNDFGSSSTPLPSNHYDNKNEKQTSPHSDQNLLDDDDVDQLYEPMEPETAGKGIGNFKSTNATLGGVNQAGGEGNVDGNGDRGLASSKLEDEGSDRESDSMYDNGVNHDDNVTEGGRNSHVNDLERVTSMSGENAGAGYDNNNNDDGNYNGNKQYSIRSSKTATGTGASPRAHAMSDIGSDGDIISEDLHDYIGTAGIDSDNDNINNLNNDPFGNNINNDVGLEIENSNYDPNKLLYRASRAEGMGSNVNSGKLNANGNAKGNAGGNASANGNDNNGGAINTVGNSFDENDAALDAISTNPGPASNIQQKKPRDSIDEVFDPAPANGSSKNNDKSKGSNDLTTVTEDETPETETDNGKTDGDDNCKNNGNVNEDQQNQKVDSTPLGGVGNIV